MNERKFNAVFAKKGNGKNISIEEITAFSFSKAVYFKQIKPNHFKNVKTNHLASLIAVAIDQAVNENVFSINGLEKDLHQQDISLN